MTLSFREDVKWKAEEVRTSSTTRAPNGAGSRGYRNCAAGERKRNPLEVGFDSVNGVIGEAVLEVRKLRANVRPE
jgi:hypothetical protein